MDECWAFDVGCLLNLRDEVTPVGGTRRCDVVHVMGKGEGNEVLLGANLAGRCLSDGCGCGLCTFRCRTRSLNSSVHVCLVIVADVSEVVAPLECA